MTQDLGTEPFNGTPYFAIAEAQAELLADAFKSGEAGYTAKALDTIARARGVIGLDDPS